MKLDDGYTERPGLPASARRSPFRMRSNSR